MSDAIKEKTGISDRAGVTICDKEGNVVQQISTSQKPALFKVSGGLSIEKPVEPEGKKNE